MGIFGGSSSPSTDTSSKEVKEALFKQVQAESAMSNARTLISNVNEHCFEACVPNPGTSMSAGEQACLTDCMEKYIAFWNTVSRTYTRRVGTEQKRMLAL
ncbi:protein translocase subunit TIM13 [Aspergillus luchuensis]|uniref:Mitochondrial import inner membrane translocase subunit n=3 Tax=Aspergillus subgen. Circumdati TaxID=2720871 RepID=A0A146FL93_ASPKA|nr:hypothetical protein BO85DRAFT_368168 [Aspergillus piperis CBS 112811]XP_041540083.1 protein translocase subunit [Aspergillus luchuensis]OJZ91872.1 hypothetical protein ASPFODRAFT_39058 [Aspergillus luchuensis CBS 106.47]GAA82268.1 hypothetical protein AKAW_00383 [Aspergillus luchuensis IFO 4308]RAH59892.1 hypothetical protein BO85DRAFT_368168 [Aspergillus piperis CBS 112811]BCR96317.1 protein translocase subunit [Aspergillus luchuensis]BCS08832.1 protein translocase subunit [Aspergillus l